MSTNWGVNSCRTPPASALEPVFIAYGTRGGILLHISKVARGLDCDCSCPGCGKPLVAKKGTRRREHFAHTQDTSCDGGLETVLHRLAKELFVGIDKVIVPEYRFHRERMIDRELVSSSVLVVPSKAIAVRAVQVETRLDNLVPDLVVMSAEGELLIEIAVTHRVDADKLYALRALDRPVLEIRLTREDAFLSRAQLRIKLAEDKRSKHWLFHPKELPHEARFQAEVDGAMRRAEAERLANSRFLADTLARAQRRPLSRDVPAADAPKGNWLDAERVVDEFVRTLGRYPTLEEMKALFVKRER